MDDFLLNLVETLIAHSPLYLVLFAGLVFAVARWSSHPAASLRAALGFGWLTLFGLAAVVWRDCRLSETVIPEQHVQWPTDDRKTDLWIVPTEGSAQRLTSERANDRSPQWDPDGQLIYFLGNRKREGEKRPPYDGKTQVWRIPVTGGTPEAVTRVEGGVDA